MNEWSVRPWARPFVGPETDVAPTRKRIDRSQLSEEIESRQAATRQAMTRYFRRAQKALAAAVGLFIATQIPVLPMWLRVILFFACTSVGCMAWFDWWQGVVYRKLSNAKLTEF